MRVRSREKVDADYSPSARAPDRGSRHSRAGTSAAPCRRCRCEREWSRYSCSPPSACTLHTPPPTIQPRRDGQSGSGPSSLAAWWRRERYPSSTSIREACRMHPVTPDAVAGWEFLSLRPPYSATPNYAARRGRAVRGVGTQEHARAGDAARSSGVGAGTSGTFTRSTHAPIPANRRKHPLPIFSKSVTPEPVQVGGAPCPRLLAPIPYPPPLTGVRACTTARKGRSRRSHQSCWGREETRERGVAYGPTRSPGHRFRERHTRCRTVSVWSASTLVGNLGGQFAS